MGARRFAALTGMRGAAAVWVVMFHAYPFVGSLFGWPERAFIPVIRDGFLAVDLFFILSGFVLSHAYADRFRVGVPIEYAAFMAARVRRVFPLHWVCLGIVVLLVRSFPDYRWGPGPFSSQALIGSALLIQTWIPSTAQAWNHPAWSLSAEWLAYLLFPFIAAATRLFHRTSLSLVGAALFILVLEVSILSRGETTLDHVGMGGIVRCLCEFTAGALVWRSLQGEAGSVAVNGGAWIIAGMVVLCISIFDPLVQVIVPFGFAALIIGCALPSNSGRAIFGNRLLMSLGEISFSIYLVHAPILASLALIADRFRLHDAALLPKLMIVAAIPTLVLSASIVLWRFVEVPGRMLFRSAEPLKASHPPIFVTLAFWLLIVVAMTFSETAGDFLSGTMALGYSLSTAILLTAAISILFAQIDIARENDLLNWGLVLCVSIAGTTLSDFLDTSVGLGDSGASVALLIALLAGQGAWRLLAAHNQSVSNGKFKPVLNWLIVLVVAALCTSVGDLLSAQLGFLYGGGALFILAGLACIALASISRRLPRTVLFWMAFVLIRPLGVSLGDALSQSHASGGLQFGAGGTSLILAGAMIVLIPIAQRQFLNLIRQLDQGRLRTAFT